MDLKKITAIINSSVLEDVEQRLTELGVKGFSESNVTGRGEYANFYRADLNAPHVKMEIFTEKSKVDGIVSAIMEAAHRGTQEDGIIAVLPVDKLYRIRTKSEFTIDGFQTMTD